MRRLFLDDNPARRKWANEELGPDLVLCEDARQAITAMRCAAQYTGPFDEVYLDHDLGDEHQDSSHPNCGMEVVRWIVEHRPTIGRVVVHSLNVPAANRMVEALTEAGYQAEYVNFIRLVESRP